MTINTVFLSPKDKTRQCTKEEEKEEKEHEQVVLDSPVHFLLEFCVSVHLLIQTSVNCLLLLGHFFEFLFLDFHLQFHTTKTKEM